MSELLQEMGSIWVRLPYLHVPGFAVSAILGLEGEPQPTIRYRAHTLACLYHSYKSQTARSAWMSRWPNRCSRCEGAGVLVSSYDPSPAGVSLSPGSIEETEPCECVELGACPRCGVAFYTIRPTSELQNEAHDEWISLYERLPRCKAELQVIRMNAIDLWHERRPECAGCGWTWGARDIDTMPALYECACYAHLDNPVHNHELERRGMYHD
jgi:hypothetical protein